MGKKQVVVPYDFSATADVALRRALELAWRAPDHVLHVVHVFGRHGQHHAEMMEHQLHDRVVERIAEHGEGPAPELFVHALIGDPVTEILRLAETVGADMIVIGSHGRSGLRRLLLGSVSELVVRRAGCAVVVARPKEYQDVVFEKVYEVDAHGPTRGLAHRYSYASSIARTRPDEWPLN